MNFLNAIAICFIHTLFSQANKSFYVSGYNTTENNLNVTNFTEISSEIDLSSTSTVFENPLTTNNYNENFTVIPSLVNVGNLTNNNISLVFVNETENDLNVSFVATTDYKNLINSTNLTIFINYDNLNDTDYDYIENSTVFIDNSTLYENITDVLNTTDYEVDVTTTEAPSIVDDYYYKTDEYCMCDLKSHECDINCCCDELCSEDDRLVFSECVDRHPLILDSKYCFQKEIFVRNNTKYIIEKSKGGLFCIITDNLPERTKFKQIQGADTLRKFETLPRPTTHYRWNFSSRKVEFKYENLKVGAPLWTINNQSKISQYGLPSAILNDNCESMKMAHYMIDQTSSCTIHLDDLMEKCETVSLLSANKYLESYFIAFLFPEQNQNSSNETFSNSTSKDIDEFETTTSSMDEMTTNYSAKTDESNVTTKNSSNFTLPSSFILNGTTEPSLVDQNMNETLINNFMNKEDTFMVLNGLPVIEVTPFMCSEKNICIKVINVSSPYYDGNFCHNVVNKLIFNIYHNGTKGIVSIDVHIHLATLSNTTDAHHIIFEMRYKWANQKNDVVFVRSGRPGYIIGKPILAGSLLYNSSHDKTLKAISLNVDTSKWLNILSSNNNGECGGKTSVNFGEDVKSSCLIRLTNEEVTHNCSKLKSRIMNLILGSSFSNIKELRIAVYGDSSVTDLSDWLPVFIQDELRSKIIGSNAEEETTHCYGVVGSIELEIAYALQGTLANPQNKIVGAYLKQGLSRDIFPKCEGISCDYQASQIVELSTTVSFVDVSKASIPHYAQPPSIDVKLPYDFFYPFLPSSSPNMSNTFKTIVFTALVFIFINQ